MQQAAHNHSTAEPELSELGNDGWEMSGIAQHATLTCDYSGVRSEDKYGLRHKAGETDPDRIGGASMRRKENVRRSWVPYSWKYGLWRSQREYDCAGEPR